KNSQFELQKALEAWDFKKAFECIEKLKVKKNYEELLKTSKRDLSEFLRGKTIVFENLQKLEKTSLHCALARIVDELAESKVAPNGSDIIRLSHLLYSQNSKGANAYFSKLIYGLETKNYRIAILVCGALRGDYKKAFLDLHKEAKALNADIFVFSWDKACEWIGASGNGVGFLRGFFDEKILKNAPEIVISSNEEFSKKFPRTFSKVSKEKLRKVDTKFFKGLPSIKAFKFESLQDLQNKEELSNTIKMFYGYAKVLELLENYEKENEIKYDFLIRIRPDMRYEFPKREKILTLKQKEVACNLYTWGLNDMIEIGHSKDLKAYLNTLNLAKIRTDLPYFREYPKAILNTPNTPFLSHGYLFFYFISLGLIPVNLGAKFQRNKTLYENFTLVNCLKELKKDLKLLKHKGLSQSQSDEITAFFELITLFKQAMFIKASFRVQNFLSYKLGSAMVQSTIFEKLILPCIFLKIYFAHRICAYKYKQILQKNPHLKLPPLESYSDYKEALRFKEHLSYKLGNAFLKAYKNVWGGGIIKYIFIDVPRIKREWREKQKEKMPKSTSFMS
ncbi:hypothetical protein K4G58_07455, partial [Helicobacter sp. Faydin-H64]|nr:hypothetical protein [Helicobacter turcicus]